MNCVRSIGYPFFRYPVYLTIYFPSKNCFSSGQKRAIEKKVPGKAVWIFRDLGHWKQYTHIYTVHA